MRKLFIFSIASFALIFAFISFDIASNNTNGSQISNGSIQINEKVNKSGDLMTGDILFKTNNSYCGSVASKDYYINLVVCQNYTDSITPYFFESIVANTTQHSNFLQLPDKLTFDKPIYAPNINTLLAGSNIAISTQNNISTLSSNDNSKVNKSGDIVNGSLIENSYPFQLYSNAHYAFPHSKDNNTGLIGSLTGVDLNPGVWNLNLMTLSNGVWFNTSCGNNDSYGGSLGYCWQYGKRHYGSMAYQFVNDVFSYYVWDANINSSKLNIQNESDHTQGYYKRMDFGNNLDTYYGNINLHKNGSGITLYAPNGNPWCTTVTNGGTLNTAAGVCT